MLLQEKAEDAGIFQFHYGSVKRRQARGEKTVIAEISIPLWFG